MATSPNIMFMMYRKDFILASINLDCSTMFKPTHEIYGPDQTVLLEYLLLAHIETPFIAFVNKADPDQAALELPEQGILCLLMDI